MKKKTLTILTTTLFFLTLTTAQITITDPSNNYATDEEFDITVENDSQINGNLDFKYINVSAGDSWGGDEVDIATSVSPSGSENTVSSGTDPSGNGYTEMEIGVYDDNGGPNELNDTITVHWDEVNPAISDDSMSVTRENDGSVDFDWSMEGSGYSDGGYDFTLSRRTDSSDSFENVQTGSASDGNTGAEITYENSDNYYGDIAFDLEINDAAGNSLETQGFQESYLTSTDGLEVNSNHLNLSIADGNSPKLTDLQIDGESYYSEDDGFDDDILVNTDSPEIEAEFDDELSGLQSANLTFDDGTEEDGFTGGSSSSETVSVDLTDYDDNTYDLDFDAEDQAGNSLSESTTFSIDTSSPLESMNVGNDIRLKPNPDERGPVESSISAVIVEIDDNDYQNENIETVECFVGDPSDLDQSIGTDSDPELAGGDTQRFDCGELNIEDYNDGEQNIYVEVTDAAGNLGEAKLGTYTFDSEPPAIEEVEISGDYVNEEPEVYVEAENEGTEINEAEYTFSEDRGQGEANELDIDEANEINFTFKPNMTNLQDGEYTVRVRVKSGTDEWSDDGTETFTLDRDATPNASLDPEPIVFEAGENETDYTVEVSNEGKVTVTGAKINFTDDVVSGETEEFSVPGESTVDEEVSVETNKSFGQYTTNLVLNTESELIEEDVEVNVEATDSEREEVNNSIQSLESSIQDLRSDIQYLEEQGASEDVISDAEEELEKLEGNLDELDNASESGDYYRVADDLENVDGWSSMATEAGDDAREQHSENMTWFYIQVGGASGLLLLLVVGGVLFKKSDYVMEVNPPEDFEFSNIPEYLGNSVEAMKHKLSEVGSGGESEESKDNDDWEGFD